MPIKDKDLGKYKRPGIFMNEIDNSVIELPVQDVLVNFVPGFSKKGPFNAPIYVTNPNDFESIFGSEDKRLENKGSFFHKTVKQMLKSGPVWALSLLDTDPNRDKLEWQTISVSAQYENSSVNSTAYESFFNRQSFWERDTDAFLDIVKNNNSGVQDDNRLLHITNMGDKDITVFMFKSDVTGFDVTAEEWYGGRDKVPLYMNHGEWISDYMVSVIVLGGDWTDYKTLANDPKFSNFFDRNGLIKAQAFNLLNEPTVTVLANYDVSLIPYFKDLNDRDMYIKTVINNNTDKTGLFCTYNEDNLFEAEFKLGNLDIIGDVLVGQDYSSINFMSYNTTLKEALTYSQKYLDSANNVFCSNSTEMQRPYSATTTRSAVYTNGNTYGISTGTTILTGASYTTLDLTLDAGAYYIMNGTAYDVESSLSAVTMTALPQTSTYEDRYDVLYLTTDTSTVSVLYGDVVVSNISQQTATLPNYTYSLDSTIILGYVYHNLSGTTYTATYTPVTVGGSGNINLGSSSFDINTDVGETYMEIEFLGTSGMTGTYNDYKYLRVNHLFNEMETYVEADKTVLIKVSGDTPYFSTMDKTPITSVTVVDATSTANAKIRLYVENATNYYDDNHRFLLYYLDDEFVISNNDTNRLKTVYQEITEVPTYLGNNVGIVGKYSTFYLNYYNGIINSNDYFWQNNSATTVAADKFYLKMFIDQSGILIADIMTYDGTSYTQQVISGWESTSTYDKSLIVYSDKSSWKQSIEIESWVGDDLTSVQEISVDKTRYSEIKRGDFLEAYYDTSNWLAPDGAGYLEGSVPRKFTRIINIRNSTTDTSLKTLYTDAPIRLNDMNMVSGSTNVDYQTFTYQSIDQYVDNYKGLKISPFVVHQDSIPDGTDTRQNAILDVLAKETNLAKSLADKNKIAWRYLVDSFGLGLKPMTNYGSKQQLADLTGMKLNALGFINMPSVKDFRNSTNPSFVNDDGSLNLEYVKNGADESKNPDYLYQFATTHEEVDGKSTVGYFFPYVRVYDNGIPKWVPPASYAATTYMQKFVSNVAGLVPWTICAGITNGRVNGITKTEMDFITTDLEYLHAMGANPIVFKLNNGYCINDEATAQVYPFSSLSFMHSREVLIELENRLYDMLLSYQWSFNTAEVRAEIKYKADKICKEMLDASALYDFKNVCDETNNTDYIIDLQMGVLDTYIEIIKGMGIIVNNITILKKGDIQSGGFQ